MFTIDQIKAAHSRVTSGADFPKFIQEIKTLGVTKFETWVADSHTDYTGANNYQVSSAPMYDPLMIAGGSDKSSFASYLKTHQQGATDYLTFCRHCAETGIEKWIVSLDEMSCTYYDQAGNKVLTEQIPQ